MKVRIVKPKHQRMFKTVSYKPLDGLHKGKKVLRPFCIEPLESGWWFCLKKGQWEPEYNGRGYMTTSYYSLTYDGFNNAYSLKAVKRLIHKWNVPKGTVFMASLPFKGHTFYITKN